MPWCGSMQVRGGRQCQYSIRCPCTNDVNGAHAHAREAQAAAAVPVGHMWAPWRATYSYVFQLLASVHDLVRTDATRAPPQHALRTPSRCVSVLTTFSRALCNYVDDGPWSGMRCSHSYIYSSSHTPLSLSLTHTHVYACTHTHTHTQRERERERERDAPAVQREYPKR